MDSNSDASFVQMVDITVPQSKGRLSLFKPDMSPRNEYVNENESKEPDDHNNILEEYRSKLRTEKDSWKTMYNEAKKKSLALRKKVNCKPVQHLDITILDEEDMNYINAGPNYAQIIEEIEDLFVQTQVMEEKLRLKQHITKCKLTQLETKLEVINRECCEFVSRCESKKAFLI